MCASSGILGRDVPQRPNPRLAMLPQRVLPRASGMGVRSRLSRVRMMCSAKEMSRPFLDSLSGDIQGQETACPPLCWFGDSVQALGVRCLGGDTFSEIQVGLTACPLRALWAVTQGSRSHQLHWLMESECVHVSQPCVCVRARACVHVSISSGCGAVCPSPQPGSTVGQAPDPMGWLQRKELTLAVALRGSGQSLEVPSLPGVPVWERKPSGAQMMAQALEGAPPGSWGPSGQEAGRRRQSSGLSGALSWCSGGSCNRHPAWSSCSRESPCPVRRGLAWAQGSAWGRLCGSS